jgi:hypothetical protein
MSLNLLLADAAPSGKRFSMNEMLERGEGIVERQHNLSLANRAEPLTSIGNNYVAQIDEGRPWKMTLVIHSRPSIQHGPRSWTNGRRGNG